MTVLVLLAGSGFAAGILGSLLGLGGGILIVPLLTFGFGLPFREAVGVSLVCVIVTSSAAASVYLERHLANLRLGMLLEVFTASGALIGGVIAFLLPDRVLAALFALLLVYTGVTMLRRGAPGARDVGPAADAADHPGAAAVAQGTFRAALAGPGYRPARLAAGVGGSVFAGLVSALLGVGGGIVKVPLMHLVMRIPLKVATATSNLMIGVTASASAIVYLMRGGIDPLVAGPTAVGVFAGAMVGSRIAQRIDLRLLRLLFVAVLALTAIQMTLRAVG